MPTKPITARKRLSSYSSLRKYWNQRHLRDGCKKSVQKYTSKYTSRPSPPFPANESCGKRKRGNDGNWWVSKKSVTGICMWKKLN